MNMKKIFCWMLTAILACGAMSAQAQVMKAADLEKYAKEKPVGGINLAHT